MTSVKSTINVIMLCVKVTACNKEPLGGPSIFISLDWLISVSADTWLVSTGRERILLD